MCMYFICSRRSNIYYFDEHSLLNKFFQNEKFSGERTASPGKLLSIWVFVKTNVRNLEKKMGNWYHHRMSHFSLNLVIRKAAPKWLTHLEITYGRVHMRSNYKQQKITCAYNFSPSHLSRQLQQPSYCQTSFYHDIFEGKCILLKSYVLVTEISIYKYTYVYKIL